MIFYQHLQLLVQDYAGLALRKQEEKQVENPHDRRFRNLT